VRFHIVSILPELCASPLEHSIVGRAIRRGLIEVDLVDPRRWAAGRHRKADDRPFGGGPGMVLAAPPIAGALDWLATRAPRARRLITSPQGRRLDQAFARELATCPDVVVICGHYEGIDERIVELYQPEPFSLGDYVLSGGELAAMVLVDAVTRLVPGVLGNAESAVADSFTAGDDLDHPCFTRPRSFRGLDVPQALIDGDHAGVAAWRAAQRAQAEARRAGRRD
jgi:tRNA (guanine37-N1)-methyltransferase